MTGGREASLGRRGFLGAGLAAAAALAGAVPAGARPRRAGHVVLYSSVDDHLLRLIVKAFEAQSGLVVDTVGDTEATKTTGLVQRLISEKAAPRADVWWSSEPFGTMTLANEGLLAPYRTKALEDFAGPGGHGDWPEGLRSRDALVWYGFACRARVIAYNTVRLPADKAPRRASDLIDPSWKGRVGMARPQFGTTRGQMGFYQSLWGDEQFRAWLKGLKDNGVRLYDGNSAVVRGISQGEIDVGLTDTDDVYAAQREKWPVALVLEAHEAAPGEGEAGPPMRSPGAMPIPNTAALVKGGPNGDAGRGLLDYILGARVERMLASSESRNTPIRPALLKEFPANAIPGAAALDIPRVAYRIPAAMKACDEVLGA